MPLGLRRADLPFARGGKKALCTCGFVPPAGPLTVRGGRQKIYRIGAENEEERARLAAIRRNAAMRPLSLAAALAATFTALTPFAAQAQKVGPTDIGGVVTGPKGPEAGVWVIAETSDFQTRYSKIVITD